MDKTSEKFAFRSRITRETSFSIDYDELYDLLEFERQYGFIVWVLGPAVVFDRDARNAFAELVNRVTCMRCLRVCSGNPRRGGLAVLNRARPGYLLQANCALGHYNHLDAINTIRRVGSLSLAIDQGIITDGSCVQ